MGHCLSKHFLETILVPSAAAHGHSANFTTCIGSSQSTSASGLHRQGLAASSHALCPMGLNVCTSQTQPLPSQARHGLVSNFASLALRMGAFFRGMAVSRSTAWTQDRFEPCCTIVRATAAGFRSKVLHRSKQTTNNTPLSFHSRTTDERSLRGSRPGMRSITMTLGTAVVELHFAPKRAPRDMRAGLSIGRDCIGF
jgi:hypothetical protein